MAISGIKKSYSAANLKSGVVGIKVSIMPRELKEKYEIQLRDLKEEVIEEIKSLDNNLDNKIGQVEEIEKKKPKVKKEEKIIKQEKNENSKYKTSEKKPKVKKEEKIIKQEKNDEIQNSEESSELSEVVGEEYEN